MSDNKQDSIAIFDTLFTNNHICMMKLLLPLLSPSLQKNIAIYIKYLELQYTMQYFTRHPYGHILPQSNQTSNSFDFDTVYEDILPYCTPTEKQSFTQLHNMVNTFQSMKSMMELINTMKDLFPEGVDMSGGFNPEMLAGLSSMFGGEDMDLSQMSELFQAFQNGS